jgi:chromosome segregation ATPase
MCTDLAKLKENIAQIRSDAEKWLNMCQREQSRLPQLEAAVNDLTVEFAKFRELDDQRAKISKLQIQLFWAKFEEAEKMLEAAKAEVKKAQKKCENVVKKQGELEAEIIEKTAEKESIKAEQEDHLEAAKTVKERGVAAAEALTDARKPLAALLAAQRKHQLALRELTSDKDKVVK